MKAKETGLESAGLDKGGACSAHRSAKCRVQLPQFTITTPAMVTAAEGAVKAAELARDIECKKVGEKCRQRMDDVTVAQAKLAEATAARAQTEQAEKLDAELATAREELMQLGPLPAHADATAARVARIIGLFVPVGGNADEAVVEWRPIVFALIVELLAALGTFAMNAAFSESVLAAGSGELKAHEHTPASKRPAQRKRSRTFARDNAGAVRSAASPVRSKRGRKTEELDGAGVANVREFF
jgi:hypothetical protein